MIIDLLVHTEEAEGGAVAPEALMEAAKSAGLDGLVLAGPDGTLGDIEAYAEAAEAKNLAIFPGAALETESGLLLVVVPSDKDLPEFEMDGELVVADRAIDAIVELGGATVALRPYDRTVDHPMGDHLFSLQGIHACEVLSGRATEVANDLALEAASNLELPCVGTSAARGAEGIGTAATLFRRPVEQVEDLIEQLESGDCWPVGFGEDVPRDLDEGRGRRRDNRSGGRRDGNRSGGRGGRSDGRRNGGGGGGGGGRGRRERAPARVTEAPEHADRLPDDIGNRLAPGEASPFHSRED